MGFFDALRNVASKMSDAGERYVERQTNDYRSGYDIGRDIASSMSDNELRSELKRAKDNGISGMKNAGKTRAMLDEYKERNK